MMKPRILLYVLAAVAGAMLLVGAAWGQDAAVPPVPALSRSPHAAIGYGVMFLLLVAVIVVSLMPSKRGHQD